ncbi:MAG: AMP-binding enzyme [Desulfocucumaceae bacterium]
MNECPRNEDQLHSQVRELEKIILHLDGVSDVVVISVEKPSGEQALRAFVEQEDETDVNARALISQSFKKSSYGSAPITITFGKIPRTPSGKVLRQQLLGQCAG